MPQNNNPASPVAISYARALLELSNERRLAEDVSRELLGISQILEAEPVFKAYLTDRALGAMERGETIRRIFKGRVSDLILNFLEIVNNHNRMNLIDEVLRAFGELLDEQLGNIDVEVTSAHPLGDEEIDQVRQRISKSLGKNAIVEQKVNDKIIGGLVIRVGDQVIDASVRQQLRSIRQQFHGAAGKVRV